MDEKFSITNKTKDKLPDLPFLFLKNDILGKDYSLSVAFIKEKESRTINKKYREKNKPTNILSFLLHKDEGEIVMCPTLIKKEAKNFGKTFSQFLGFLIIHGMLHLKGLEHGEKMDELEILYCKKFGINL